MCVVCALAKVFRTLCILLTSLYNFYYSDLLFLNKIVICVFIYRLQYFPLHLDTAILTETNFIIIIIFHDTTLTSYSTFKVLFLVSSEFYATLHICVFETMAGWLRTLEVSERNISPFCKILYFPYICSDVWNESRVKDDGQLLTTTST